MSRKSGAVPLTQRIVLTVYQSKENASLMKIVIARAKLSIINTHYERLLPRPKHNESNTIVFQVCVML